MFTTSISICHCLQVLYYVTTHTSFFSNAFGAPFHLVPSKKAPHSFHIRQLARGWLCDSHPSYMVCLRPSKSAVSLAMPCRSFALAARCTSIYFCDAMLAAQVCTDLRYKPNSILSHWCSDHFGKVRAVTALVVCKARLACALQLPGSRCGSRCVRIFL